MLIVSGQHNQDDLFSQRYGAQTPFAIISATFGAEQFGASLEYGDWYTVSLSSSNRCRIALKTVA